MPLTTRGTVGLGSLNFKISPNRATLIEAIQNRPSPLTLPRQNSETQEKMSDESLDLKAASEAAVAKFQLERVLNQGTLPTQ